MKRHLPTINQLMSHQSLMIEMTMLADELLSVKENTPDVCDGNDSIESRASVARATSEEGSGVLLFQCASESTSLVNDASSK